MVLTQVLPTWVPEVVGSYKQDDLAQNRIGELLLLPNGIPDWGYKNGMLKYKGMLYIDCTGEIREKLTKALHSSKLGGHFGIQASYIKAKSLCYWPTVLNDFIEVTLCCDVCRRRMDEHNQYPRLLQPLPEPQYSWSHITMNFIKGLPKSQEKEVILVVVDRFTKSAHFLESAIPIQLL
ncbi:hypothetical protein ACH5RR_018466 [Cinchona calisaya]|uniref:Integrase zinc-binding domain-containing protein n=1 Tax=Cinchona calisaya TaxID=153742 RepID=A0ABD2ZLJ9_9GENT